MFGSSNPFGQSSSSPFGSQSVFGSNNANNNPFAPKPFGSTSPFGSQTGGSIFGGTSTGVFGATQSSTPTFGASSTPAFGASSTPAFGTSSTPAFGASSSFGGSSVFGQKPAFGGFGSTPTQTSPFGSSVQQTQSAFGSNLFGSSTPFGQPSQPAFGSTSTPAFGSTSTPAFGMTGSSAFGSTTPAFGASTPAFGASSTPAFGSTSTSAFGTGTAFGNTGSAFGTSSTPAFGSSTTSPFGAPSTPAFGSSSTPVFGATSSAFGASSSPSFSFGSSPFGQSSSAFGSTPFGAAPSPFGAQSSSFGSQTATPTFGSTGFGQTGFGGQQRGGSRVQSYTPTAEVDGGSSTQAAGKLESISAMPVYKEKSHEELRWEDYQLGDKGGPNPAVQPGSSMGMGFGQPAQQSNPFGTSPTFGQTSANPFSSTTPSNPFAQKTSTFGTSAFGTPTSAPNSSPFGSSTPANPNPFGATSSTPSLFSQTPNPFGASTSSSIFGQTTTPAFSSPSIFGSATAPNTSSPFGGALNIGNTQSAPLFQSTTPALGQTGSAFGQTNSPFGQTTSAFGQTNSTFGQTNSPFGQTSQPTLFSTPSTGFGFSTSSTPSLFPSSNQPSFSTPFQSAQPAQTSGGFPFNNTFSQSQPASSGFGTIQGGFGQSTFGQQTQNAVAMQPTPVSNPFGTLPAMPQMSIGGRSGSSPTVQYGISSMPVTDKPDPVRVSSLLTTRHVSHRRVGLPSRKYNPKNDSQRVSFFSDDEDEVQHSTPKADALFIPRENPRALVIRPTEKWPSKATPTPPKDTHENNGRAENGPVQEIKLTSHRAGEAAIVYEHGADIEALMPKLKHSDYYTEPKIQELAAKERAEPGYCQRVKDFVVGRSGYGSIRFIGETDVRRLDLESIVQFNNREVIVYLDDSKKPPVGQGLNKAAEVTLLNIKCMDKKTGKQYTEGAKVEKYKEMLMKKASDQGAEFVSYDPVKGEWRFRVEHFSVYCFESEDEEEEDV